MSFCGLRNAHECTHARRCIQLGSRVQKKECIPCLYCGTDTEATTFRRKELVKHGDAFDDGRGVVRDKVLTNALRTS